MDYVVFTSLMADAKQVEQVTFSYDIACQWCRNIEPRLASYKLLAKFKLKGKWIAFVIPDFHLLAHGDSCQIPYAFDYTEGSGVTCGEGIESGWAAFNLVGASTREMGTGSRKDTLNDILQDYNYQKKQGMGRSLAAGLDRAKENLEVQSAAYIAFTSTFPAEAVRQ